MQDWTERTTETKEREFYSVSPRPVKYYIPTFRFENISISLLAGSIQTPSYRLVFVHICDIYIYFENIHFLLLVFVFGLRFEGK